MTLSRCRRLASTYAAFADAAWACLSIASMICGHIGIGSAWPMPSIIRSLAPGIEAAVEGALGARAIARLVLGKAANPQNLPGLREAREIFLFGFGRRRHQHGG